MDKTHTLHQSYQSPPHRKKQCLYLCLEMAADSCTRCKFFEQLVFFMKKKINVQYCTVLVTCFQAI